MRSRGWSVTGPRRACERTFEVRAGKEGRPELRLVVAVNGVDEYDFETHEIEDHGVLLRELEGELDRDLIKDVKRARELVRREELPGMIRKAAPRSVREAFGHVACLLERAGGVRLTQEAAQT